MTAVPFVEMLYSVLLSIAVFFGMTTHAEQSHVGEYANARSITQSVENELKGKDSCDELQVHFCWGNPEGHQPHAKVICIHNNRRLVEGLVIGLAGDTKVVTGYSAPVSYWAKCMVRDRCFPVSVTMLQYWFDIMFPGVLH